MDSIQKMRKAQSMSTQTIVWAALALIVMIVLIAIFTGRVRLFGSTVGGTCAEQGGECADAESCQGKEGYPLLVWAHGCKCYAKDKADCAKKDKDGVGQCCLPLTR
jgi:hypothetical protein